MGLLKKKQHKLPIQALQSKNPTGLPFRDVESPDEGPNTSLLAAKAAALTFSKPINSTQQNHPVQRRTSQRRNVPSESSYETDFPKSDPTQTSRRLSSLYTTPQTNIPRHQTKQYFNNDSDSYSGKLTVETKLQTPTAISTTNHLAPPLSRPPVPHPLKSPLVSPMVKPSTPTQSSLSLLAAAAASAASKVVSSQDLMQPQMPIQSHRVYSSSSNSAISSMESLPLYAKLQYGEGSEYGSRDSFDKPRIASINSDRSRDSLDKTRLYSQNLSYSKESFERPKISTHESGISKESLSPLEFNITLSESDYEEKLSQKSGSDSNLSLSGMKSNLGSHISLDQIPITIEEHKSKEDLSEDSGLLPPPPLTNSVSSLSIKPANLKLRKPPPSSPILPASPENSFTQTPTQSLPPSQISSPKRKPPPDYFANNDDWVDHDTTAIDESHDEVESLPQYPVDFNELLKKKNHHHRHNGIRRATRKMFKKTLKSSNTESESPKPFHFKTTMRKEKKDKFNEEKPWKNHSERDFISEQERKRYEGVWVSNKGLYMNLVDPASLCQEYSPEAVNAALSASRHITNNDRIEPQQNLMLNLVVRELWNRSKLPNDTLRQIWDLVDVRRDGTIDKKSFIVGMWLVDQCLYGRKLPKQVDEGIWNSVSSLQLNVVIKPKKIKNRA